jgi:hypothetical protein
MRVIQIGNRKMIRAIIGVAALIFGFSIAQA